tara:strand:- start:128 stop:598 length:471 start_codon:yes stop_codon:yes gene_type:complete
MGRKKIVRKPIEKLSEKEHIEVIEDSSSSEEEFDDIPPPPKLVKEKPKRERSAKQLANDQRLRDAAAARRAGKSAPVKEEVTLDTSLYKSEPVKETPKQDPDDKPLTMKQYKALIASQTGEVKPKRKYVKKEKQVVAAPTPTPSPTPPQKPNMMFV